MQSVGTGLFGFIRGGLSGSVFSAVWNSSAAPWGSCGVLMRGLSTLSSGLPMSVVNSCGSGTQGLLSVSTPLMSQVRTNIRNHFPRPRESKRVLTHGWKTRLKTPSGRKIIMRRILKGRYILSH